MSEIINLAIMFIIIIIITVMLKINSNFKYAAMEMINYKN